MVGGHLKGVMAVIDDQQEDLDAAGQFLQRVGSQPDAIQALL